MLVTLRQSRRHLSLAVLGLMIAGWLSFFCDQCWAWTETAGTSNMTSCCPAPVDPSPQDTANHCDTGLSVSCVSATERDSEAAIASQSSNQVDAVAFALLLMLAWPVLPGLCTDRRRYANKVVYYDPRLLERIRLLLI